MIVEHCWDQIAEGYPIPNTEKNVKVNMQKVGSEGVNHSVDVNKCVAFLPLGKPPGGLFIGVVRGPVIMSERPP
jgi:hypothetical protein